MTLAQMGTRERLTIDLTVMHDFLGPQRSGHGSAKELFALAEKGEVELAVSPQGHRLDAFEGDLAQRLQQAIKDNEGVVEARQLAYVSDVTFPSFDLYPGQYVPGFREAWQSILRT